MVIVVARCLRLTNNERRSGLPPLPKLLLDASRLLLKSLIFAAKMIFHKSRALFLGDRREVKNDTSNNDASDPCSTNVHIANAGVVIIIARSRCCALFSSFYFCSDHFFFFDLLPFARLFAVAEVGFSSASSFGNSFVVVLQVCLWTFQFRCWHSALQ